MECYINIDFKKLYKNLFEKEIKEDKSFFMELYKSSKSQDEYEYTQAIESIVNNTRENTYYKTLEYILKWYEDE